jgi:processive 1,2-diacylglycerol beta-glucosyltransferase
MDKKKILILSMTAGSGHIRAAKALVEYAGANLPNISAEHINISDIANPLIKLFNQDIFKLSVENWPKTWGKIYDAFDNKSMASALSKTAKLQRPFSHNLSKYLKSKDPNGVIFTYSAPAQMLASTFRKYSPHIKLSLVVTDYHGHSFYNVPNIDRLFVPNQKVKDELLRAGVEEGRMSITGIPVNPRFYLKPDIEELRSKYGLNNERPTVLFMASFLLSQPDLITAVKQLLAFDPKINLVFVASGNKDFYDAITKFFPRQDRLTVVNWTDTIDEYMRISDVVISKAGGLTVSECLNLNKPMILLDPIPGQEERNAEFIEENNLGVRIANIGEIGGALSKIGFSERKNLVSPVPQENSCEKIFKYFE